ncbi:MAG: TPM domain-containing protein [Candidatus Absconditabacteria bacterium]|nr:TPM domain-containing protein [Candidatus Absconditabacteria bacterium]
MKSYFKKVLMFGFLVLFGGSVFAQSDFDPMNMPKITQYVVDYSNVLDQSSLQQLSSLGEAYNSSTSNQFVAVLFPNRNGNELFDIGMKLFNENQIGQAGKNNGLLLLISTEEKKIRIIVGYGLEGDLPDALVKRIIENDIRPLVDKGDFAGAVNAFYQRCSEAIANDEASSIENEFFSVEQKEEGFWIFGLILGFILASLIKQKKIKKITKKIGIPLLIVLIVVLIIWLGALLLVGIIAGLVFGFTGFLPGRGGRGFGGGSFGGGFSGGFSGGGGMSGGGGAGD